MPRPCPLCPQPDRATVAVQARDVSWHAGIPPSSDPPRTCTASRSPVIRAWPSGEGRRDRKAFRRAGRGARGPRSGSPLPQVEVRMPTQPPRGEARTRAQHVAHQRWHQRRRLAQVHSSVQRCRLGTDRIRLGKAGVRALGMLRCGARACTPWKAFSRKPRMRHWFRLMAYPHEQFC
jgi:hypothetical protein